MQKRSDGNQMKRINGSNDRDRVLKRKCNSMSNIQTRKIQRLTGDETTRQTVSNASRERSNEIVKCRLRDTTKAVSTASQHSVMNTSARNVSCDRSSPVADDMTSDRHVCCNNKRSASSASDRERQSDKKITMSHNSSPQSYSTRASSAKRPAQSTSNMCTCNGHKSVGSGQKSINIECKSISNEQFDQTADKVEDRLDRSESGCRKRTRATVFVWQ